MWGQSGQSGEEGGSRWVEEEEKEEVETAALSLPCTLLQDSWTLREGDKKGPSLVSKVEVEGSVIGAGDQINCCYNVIML